MLRNLLFFVLYSFLPLFASAQLTEDMPIFKKHGTPPPFKLTLPDSTFTTADKLAKKNKDMIVIVFSVECDHCKHLTEAIIKNIDKFKDKQVLMITPFALARMRDYYNYYHINKYPAITMASEPTRQIMNYYDLQYFPGAYTYGKNHKLVKNFEGTVEWSDLLTQ